MKIKNGLVEFRIFFPRFFSPKKIFLILSQKDQLPESVIITLKN